MHDYSTLIAYLKKHGTGTGLNDKTLCFLARKNSAGAREGLQCQGRDETVQARRYKSRFVVSQWIANKRYYAYRELDAHLVVLLGLTMTNAVPRPQVDLTLIFQHILDHMRVMEESDEIQDAARLHPTDEGYGLVLRASGVTPMLGVYSKAFYSWLRDNDPRELWRNNPMAVVEAGEFRGPGFHVAKPGAKYLREEARRQHLRVFELK